jgi:hypothetical protein
LAFPAVVEARVKVQPDVSLSLVAATMIADRPHPRRRSHRLSALLAALSLLPAAAWAGPSDADRATARTLANEAQVALDQGDFKTAADRFDRADALYHAPTLLLGLARAEIGMGKLVSAAEVYNRIINEGVPPRSPPPFVKAVDDATREFEALDARIPRVIITVRGSDAAAVTLDGTPVPRAALGVKRPTDPGEHVLRATAPGFEATPVTFTLSEGATRPVTLNLKPLLPPSPEGRGSTTQETLGIVTAGIGGAGLLIGGITGIIALNQHQTLDAACDLMTRRCPREQEDTLNSFHRVTTVSTVGFVVGGAALAAGVVLILTSSSTKPRAAPAAVGARPGRQTRAASAWALPSIKPQLGAGYIGVEGSF